MIVVETPVLANSLWVATANPATDFPRLTDEVEADVAIVGGGVTGLSAALHLAEAGLRPVVVEARSPGWGASGRNGGQLNPGLKADPDAVTDRFGPVMADRMLRLSGAAPDLAMDLVRRHGISCDAVQPGWIQAAHDESSLAAQKMRAAQWQRRGVDMRVLSKADVSALIGTDAYIGGLLDPRGGNLHPLNFTLGLAAAATKAGARIHGESPVQSLVAEAGGHVLSLPGGRLRALKVLICTNGYTDGLVTPLARTLVPVRSVQVATAPLADNIRRSILPGLQAVSDGRRVMVYYKLDAGGRLIMGGRGDYSDRTTATLMANLRRISRKTFPQLGDTPFDYAWGGFVAMTADHYPHVTPHGPGILSATGYNGRGLALGTAMGRVLADWAMGRPEGELDYPVTPARPIPFHFLRKPAVRAAVVAFRLRDALGV
ncbi:MAG: FAD-binding oxidoreductase [Paracoccaceae bacterium]